MPKFVQAVAQHTALSRGRGQHEERGDSTMSKRDEQRKLQLRRERLRQLTELSTGDAGRVAGGTYWIWTEECSEAGRAQSKTCLY
jgi:hypothetical protein